MQSRGKAKPLRGGCGDRVSFAEWERYGNLVLLATRRDQCSPDPDARQWYPGFGR